jgi:hypothetical protein
MKFIKISIFLIVLSIIAYQVYQQDPNDSGSTPEPQGIIIDHITDEVITSEIKKFKTINSVTQCIQHYDNVFYSIIHTNFDIDAANNKSIVESLNKNLYSAYAPRFLVLSKSYLGNHDWSNENITFIQNAGNKVLSSPLLEANSSLRSQYVPLMNAMQLRNNIVGFINLTNGISTACSSINGDFPDYTDMISTTSSHIATLNENGLMRNCEALKERLRNVRNEICIKHVTYLDNMIHRSSHRYFPSYVNLNAYSDNVKDVITQKIDRLGKLSNLYGKSRSDIDVFQSNLNSKLDRVYIDAYDYFTAIDNNEIHNCKYPN